eukprot:350951-Chlamydomonas_euryale.AAC.5
MRDRSSFRPELLFSRRSFRSGRSQRLGWSLAGSEHLPLRTAHAAASGLVWLGRVALRSFGPHARRPQGRLRRAAPLPDSAPRSAGVAPRSTDVAPMLRRAA